MCHSQHPNKLPQAYTATSIYVQQTSVAKACMRSIERAQAIIRRVVDLPRPMYEASPCPTTALLTVALMRISQIVSYLVIILFIALAFAYILFLYTHPSSLALPPLLSLAHHTTYNIVEPRVRKRLRMGMRSLTYDLLKEVLRERNTRKYQKDISPPFCGCANACSNTSERQNKPTSFPIIFVCLAFFCSF